MNGVRPMVQTQLFAANGQYVTTVATPMGEPPGVIVWQEHRVFSLDAGRYVERRVWVTNEEQR
jgi:hypothetical protein